jgi:hypothetical protein
LIKIKVITHLVEDSVLVVSVVVKGIQHDPYVVCTLRNIVIVKFIFYAIHHKVYDKFNFFICKFNVLIII